MTAKARRLVDLVVHARQTHAAILRLDRGELAVSRLRMAPVGGGRARAAGAGRGGGLRARAD
ncbi:MAG: hypothetical protein JO120_07535 [Solirubrobacterales bacterium]|nr:hypothetical protein [Solirubrobacterales bacterium]